MLSRFHLIPERHGLTDRQTDIIAISLMALTRIPDANRPTRWDKNTAQSKKTSRFANEISERFTEIEYPGGKVLPPWRGSRDWN